LSNHTLANTAPTLVT